MSKYILRVITFSLITIAASGTLFASEKRNRDDDLGNDHKSSFKRSNINSGDDFNEDDFAAIDDLVERHRQNKMIADDNFYDELDVDALIETNNAQYIAAADSALERHNAEYIEAADTAIAQYYSKKHACETSESSQSDDSYSGSTALNEPNDELIEAAIELHELQSYEKMDAEHQELQELEDYENSLYSNQQELEYPEEYYSAAPVFKNPLGFEGRLLIPNQDHQSFMIESIRKARNKILITSHNFSANKNNHPGLFVALHGAAERGVKVFLCYFKAHFGSETDLSPKIDRHQTNCHSKVFAVDKSILAIGSFDWLQDPTFKYADALNESMVFEDAIFKPFIKHVWRSAKMYKHLAANSNSKSQVNNIFDNTVREIISLENEDQVELVSTPQRHREFFHEAFFTAHYRIAVCASVVIDNPKFLEQYLPIDLVGRFLASEGKGLNSCENKVLEIFYNPSGRNGGKPNREILEAHLAKFTRRPNLILTPVENMHHKILMIDDSECMLGSFNLFSSAGDAMDKTHRWETSVIFSGAPASELINKFRM